MCLFSGSMINYALHAHANAEKLCKARRMSISGEGLCFDFGRILPLCQFVCRDCLRFVSEDGEAAVVDVGEFFDVACFEQGFFEGFGDGDDTMRLHESNVGDGEGAEDVFCRCMCAGAAVWCDGDIALLAAEDGEFVDDGRNRFVHDGECSRCARVCVRDGADIAAASIDRNVHHQLAVIIHYLSVIP